MTQFKEKSAKQRELVSAALFFYPVLMAADVLAYRATEVPVGDDQRQHVELMREIARRFNERFGETLVVPELPHPRGRRADHGPAGAREQDVDDRAAARPGPFYVLDEPDAIRKKLGSAVTDSGREVARGEGKPGITNLIDILAVARGTDQAEVEAEFERCRLRRLQEGGRRGGRRAPRPGPRALRRAAPRRGGARGGARRRRREGARDRRGDARRRARCDGHRPPALSCGA